MSTAIETTENNSTLLENEGRPQRDAPTDFSIQTLHLLTLSTGVSFTPEFSPAAPNVSPIGETRFHKVPGRRRTPASCLHSESFAEPLTWFLHQSRSRELTAMCLFPNHRTS